jgi:hypothetical protein
MKGLLPAQLVPRVLCLWHFFFAMCFFSSANAQGKILSIITDRDIL